MGEVNFEFWCKIPIFWQNKTQLNLLDFSDPCNFHICGKYVYASESTDFLYFETQSTIDIDTYYIPMFYNHMVVQVPFS